MTRYAALAWVLVCALVHPAASAVAQTAQERRAAAEAYDRGSSSWLAREYEQAAEWFETAHRLAPAAPALIQAVRAHDRAGNDLRAATLALRLEALYGEDRAAQRAARAVLRDAPAAFVRVDVRCAAECTIDLDGTLQEHPSFFVTPAERHTVVLAFSTGEVRRDIEGSAGDTIAVEAEAPPQAAETPSTDGAGGDGTTGDVGGTATAAGRARLVGRGGDRDEPSSGWSPAVAITGAALTAGAAAFLTWSYIDARDGVADYERMPTVEKLEAGQAKELRTEIAIGVTAGLAAATLAIAIFATDWSGGGEPEGDVRASVAISPAGGSVGVEGRF